MTKSRPDCKRALGHLLGRRCDTQRLGSHLPAISVAHTACLGMDSVPPAVLMSPGISLVLSAIEGGEVKGSEGWKPCVPSVFSSPFFLSLQRAPADAQAMVCTWRGQKSSPKDSSPFGGDTNSGGSQQPRDSWLPRLRALKPQLLRKGNLHNSPPQTGPLMEREM